MMRPEASKWAATQLVRILYVERSVKREMERERRHVHDVYDADVLDAVFPESLFELP